MASDAAEAAKARAEGRLEGLREAADIARRYALEVFGGSFGAARDIEKKIRAPFSTEALARAHFNTLALRRWQTLSLVGPDNLTHATRYGVREAVAS